MLCCVGCDHRLDPRRQPLNHTPNHNSPPDLHRDRSNQTTPLPQQSAPDEAGKRNFDGIHNVNPCVTPQRMSIDSVDRSVAIRSVYYYGSPNEDSGRQRREHLLCEQLQLARLVSDRPDVDTVHPSVPIGEELGYESVG